MQLYNTASRLIEDFFPLVPPQVGLYTCGPTVYNYAHIGNLRTYIFEDILKRVLIYNGFTVKHVMNITDVGHLVSDADSGDDKMEKGALREGKSVWEIADFYTRAFNADFAALNCLPPDIQCKATAHIPEQIALIKKLEEKNYTYRIADGIYFDVTRFKLYAQFARLSLENIKAGARVEMAEGKKHPADFALWKFSPVHKKRLMEWESPWGTGFPGWHLECSAMAMKYLGETLDIHCGGIDHIPIHHTNEIAQSEAATGNPFAKYWLHGEFLVVDKEKMAKSGSGFLTLQVLQDKGYDPLEYRYFCFSAHYRGPLSFSFEGLDGAKNALRGLRQRILEWKTGATPQMTPLVEESLKNFGTECSHDLNLPNALAVLWTTMRDGNLQPSEKLGFLQEADKVLGLGLLEEKKEPSLEDEIEVLISERQNARKNKNYKRSDEIRNLLLAKGIILEDTPQGVRWKRK
jgi:cysteinyl-tRNA synthetase